MSTLAEDMAEDGNGFPGRSIRTRRLWHHPTLRRGGWTLADQAASSLTNFAINILILRSVDLEAYGAYAVAFMVYLFALNISRSLSTEALVIRCCDEAPARARASAESSTGFSLLLGLIGAIGLLAVGAVVPRPLGSALIAVAIGLPALLLQDAWRFVFFSRGEPAKAFLNDMIWAVSQVVFLALVFWQFRPTVFVLVVAWSGSALVAALAGIIQAGALPMPLHGRAWLRRHGDLGVRFTGEYVLTGGTQQLALMSAGAIAGLSAIGAIQAAKMLLGPLQTVYQGLLAFAVPEGTRAHRRSPASFERMVSRLAIVLPMLAVMWSTVLILLPDRLLASLLGRNWSEARSVLVPVTVFFASLGATQAPRVGLRVLEAAKESFRARAIMAPFFLAFVMLGALVGGAVGTAAGFAFGGWLGVAVWWWQYQVSKTERGQSVGPFPDPLGAN